MLKRFIHRPVLAIVVSLIVVFLGTLAMKTRPVSQFPNISPPLVMVSIAYPGASAAVLVNSTLIPLERSINGVQGMRYMTSDATSAGEATIQIYFEQGTDPGAPSSTSRTASTRSSTGSPSWCSVRASSSSPCSPACSCT